MQTEEEDEKEREKVDEEEGEWKDTAPGDTLIREGLGKDDCKVSFSLTKSWKFIFLIYILF